MNNDIEWKMIKLLDKVSLLNGLTYSPENITPDGIGTLVMRSSNVQNNRFSFDDNVFVNCKIEKDKYIKKGDILVCVRNGSDELIGKNALADKNYPVTFGAFMSVLRAKDEISAKYIFWYLQKGDVIKEIRRNSEATINQITKKDFEKVLIPIPYKNGTPDMETQSLIAQKLSAMDCLITAKEKLLAKKRNLKTAVMQKVIKDEESENWKKVKVGDITQVFSGGTPSTEHPEYWNGDIPWMNSGELNLKIVNEVEGRITDLGLKSSSTHWIPTGCVLIGLAGQGKTRGTAAYNTIPLCTNQSIAAIYPNEKYFDSKFLYFYFDTQYEQLRELSSGGGGRGGLNKTHLLKYEIPIPITSDGSPDLTEQKRIATILSDMDVEISAIEKEITKLQNLKTAMMQKMFCFTEVDE